LLDTAAVAVAGVALIYIRIDMNRKTIAVVYRITEPSHNRASGLTEPFSWLPFFY